MKYVFEWGRYPDVTHEATVELSSDEEAVVMAKELDADYVWDVPEDRNPSGVYTKPR